MPLEFEEIAERVRDVMADLLDMPSRSVHPGTSMETVVGWDSLKHIMIVTAVEEEFDIEMSVGEIEIATSYQALVDLVIDRLTR